MARRFLIAASAHPTTVPSQDRSNTLCLEERRIVDAHAAVIGRELDFSGALRTACADHGHATTMEMSSAVAPAARLAAQLRELSMSAAHPGLKTFMRTSSDLLHSPGIDWLPAHTQVFVLDPAGVPDEALISRCRQLRAHGFSFALANYTGIDERSRPLLAMLDIVEIKAGNCDEAAFSEFSGLVGSLAKLPIKLLATGIDRLDQLQLCERAGFHFFQGDAVAPAGIRDDRCLPVSRAGLLRMLALLVHRASWAEIEEACKKESSLIINFLHLSRLLIPQLAPTGLGLRQVLELLGEHTLKCWLEIQLIALETDPADHADAYRHNQLAALAGRFLERLAVRLDSGEARPVDAYLAGSLAILCRAQADVMPQDFLRHLPLAPAIVSALHERDGELGRYLDILEQFDKRDALACDRKIREISGEKLAYADLQASFAEALAWLTTTDA